MTLTLTPGKAAMIRLTLYDSGGNVQNYCANDINPSNAYQGATVTWYIVGTDIEKTTADNTIISAHPVMDVAGITSQPYVDTSAPCFMIRLFKDEVDSLAGTYLYTLHVTTTDKVTYSGGFLTVGTPTPCPPPDETDYVTATISTNESITVPIGWNA